MIPEQTRYPRVAAAMDLFARWLRNRREIAELCSCDAGEFARIARDLGVSPMSSTNSFGAATTPQMSCRK